MTHSLAAQRRLLQGCVAIGGLVPVAAGLAGAVLGTGIAGGGGSPDLDSHVRYLSGLLLAIGIGFWGCVPGIERRRDRFVLLTAIVVTGGLARLWGIVQHGWPGPAMLGGLVMELGVTPALCGWQLRLAGSMCRAQRAGREGDVAPPSSPR